MGAWVMVSETWYKRAVKLVNVPDFRSALLEIGNCPGYSGCSRATAREAFGSVRKLVTVPDFGAMSGEVKYSLTTVRLHCASDH